MNVSFCLLNVFGEDEAFLLKEHGTELLVSCTSWRRHFLHAVHSSCFLFFSCVGSIMQVGCVILWGSVCVKCLRIPLLD